MYIESKGEECMENSVTPNNENMAEQVHEIPAAETAAQEVPAAEVVAEETAAVEALVPPSPPPTPIVPMSPMNQPAAAPVGAVYGVPKSKLAAGLLGIFLGAIGIHNFYLGYTGKAVAQLLICVLTCGIGGVVTGIWGLIEGIMILAGSINTDARGVALKE